MVKGIIVFAVALVGCATMEKERRGYYSYGTAEQHAEIEKVCNAQCGGDFAGRFYLTMERKGLASVNKLFCDCFSGMTSKSLGIGNKLWEDFFDDMFKKCGSKHKSSNYRYNLSNDHIMSSCGTP